MNPTEELVDLLDLERLDGDLFRGKQPESAARPRVRRPGGRPGADGRHPDGPGRLRRALAALLLPARRRLLRADRVRRRADPRRPVVHDPPGRGAPARPADLLPDAELPGARGGLRAPGRDARGRRARDRLRPGRRDAPRRQRRGRRAGQGVGRARRPLARQHPLRARARRRPRLPGPDVDPAARGAARRPGHPRRRVHLRQRRQPARLDAVGPRRQPVQDADGLARPHAVVPPALPRGRLVALRPVVAVGAGRPRPGLRADLHRRRHARGHRRAGGPDPAAPARHRGTRLKE